MRGRMSMKKMRVPSAIGELVRGVEHLVVRGAAAADLDDVVEAAEHLGRRRRLAAAARLGARRARGRR